MGVYDSLSRGIQAGYDLGARADEAVESKRRTRFQEARQTLSDNRADEEFGLRQRADRRAEERASNEEQRATVRQRLDVNAAAERSLQARRGELVGLSTAAQTAGQPVDPALGREFGDIEQRLSSMRQHGLDFFSRAATGQIDPLQASPADLYTHLAAATNMKPEELPAVAAGAKDVEAGIQTSNQGLVVQGVNKLMAPQLRIGVGTPSPHGGTITRKEIIGLDPAIDASGREHPGRVIPRMRIYTSEIGPDGKELYYDAPLTQRRTGDPDDPVVAIDLKQGMDWMGNLGALAEASQHPEMAAKLAQGAKEAGPLVDRYLEQLVNLGKPKIEKVSTPAGGRTDFVRAGQVVSSLEGPDKPPTTRNVVDGDQVSTEQWDPKTKQWVPLGKPGPRFKAPAGGAGGGGNAEPTLSEETRRTMAEQYLAGDKSVMTNLGRGAQGAANIVALREMIAKVGKELGMSGRDVALAQAEFSGTGAAQRALGTRTASFGMAKEEAYEMANLVTEASAKVSRTDFMPVNKALNAFNTNTGNTEIREFGAAINSFINAYARAVSPTGAPTVSDKDHAREMLTTADSHQQVTAIIGQLKKEMEAAGSAPGKVKRTLREDFREPPGSGGAAANSGDAPAKPAAAGGSPPVTALKEGQITTFANGQRWTLRNGQPAKVQ